MELERSIEMLEKHQEWRRDRCVPGKTQMQDPIELGDAIDYAITQLKKSRTSSTELGDAIDYAITQLKKSHTSSIEETKQYSEHEIDFAYLAGVFNVSGIDGLHKEIERLKELGKNPHDIIIAAR